MSVILEKKILYLITGRLVCATAEKHIYRSVKATVSCNGHVFAASGKTVVHNGWKDFQDICRGFINAREDNSKSRMEKEDRITDISEGQVIQYAPYFPLTTSPPHAGHLPSIPCTVCSIR